MAHRTNDLFRKVLIERATTGDLPDYLCSRSVAGQTQIVYLAEAKGRQSSISFDSKPFEKWIEQLETVDVTASNGRKISLKGFVVGTQLRREDSAGNWRTKVLCEDPKTRGEGVSDEELEEFNAVVTHFHYANVLQKIGLLLEADCLLNGYSLGEKRLVTVGKWRVLAAPLIGQEFYGAYFPESQCSVPWDWLELPIVIAGQLVSRIGGTPKTGTVFGLRTDICEQVLKQSRTDVARRERIISSPLETQNEEVQQLDESLVLSYTDDGSLFAQATAVEFLGWYQV